MKTIVRALGALLLLTTPLLATAQISERGSLRGMVRDESGAALPGATLTAESDAAPQPLSFISDARGQYRLTDLPPGDYRITAFMQGFSRAVREKVSVRAGLNLSIDFTLRVGAQEESVQVVAETPMIETTKPTQAVNVSGDLQRQLPSSGRTWAEFMDLVPGVVSSEGALAPSFHIHGADFGSTAILIDGAEVGPARQSITGYINLPIEATEDVQIRTGAVDASAPLGQGGVISLVTKGGTNRFQGTLGGIYRAKSWSGNNNPGGTVARESRLQPDVSLGGPIVKDRAWFFTSYRYMKSETGVFRSPQQIANLQGVVPGWEPFDSKAEAHLFFGRATAKVGSRHEAFASYRYDRTPTDSVLANYAEALRQFETGGTSVTARLSSQWGSRMTTRLTAAYNNAVLPFLSPRDDRPQRNIHSSAFLSAGRLTGGGAIAVLDNSASNREQPYSKWVFSLDSSYFAGAHEVSAGLYLQQLHEENVTVYPAGGFAQEDSVLRVAGSPSSGYVPFFRRTFDQTQVTDLLGKTRDAAIYAQDSWRARNNLTLTLGVRVDLVRRTDDLFNVVMQDSTEVGPRLGANWMLGSSGRHSIRAAWSRTHDNVGQNAANAGTSRVGFRDAYDLNLDGTFETVFVTPAATARTRTLEIDAERHQPFADEAIVGYRGQFDGKISIDASLVHRSFKDRSALLEVNGIYEGGVFRGYRDEAVNDVFRLTNNIWNRPLYWAAEFQISKQSDRIQALASYVKSWRRFDGDWQPNDPASFIQPGAFANSRGIGSATVLTTDTTDGNALSGTSQTGNETWRDHTVRLGLGYSGPWGLSLATSYVFQTGPWSGPVVTRIAAADPRFGPATVRLSNGRVVPNPLATTIRFVGTTRGDGQLKLPGYHRLNVRVGRNFSLPEGRRLETAVDLTNLTNDDADLFFQRGANQTYSPVYNTGRARQSPRAAQIYFRLVF